MLAALKLHASHLPSFVHLYQYYVDVEQVSFVKVDGVSTFVQPEVPLAQNPPSDLSLLIKNLGVAASGQSADGMFSQDLSKQDVPDQIQLIDWQAPFAFASPQAAVYSREEHLPEAN